ncbi:MAG: PilZ domain-containing protein [Sphingobium sp.]|nr:PilZ domain-containing protein [Sphingobium sp.]
MADEPPIFSAEINIRTESRRRSVRAAVAMEVEIDGETFSRGICRVLDISIHGARVQTYSPLTKRSTIGIAIPGQERKKAIVMWVDDLEAGCQFDTPIDPAALEELLKRNRGSGITKN